MWAIIDQGAVIALYLSREHAEEQKQALGLTGTIEPVTFGNDPARIKLQMQWKLEKFEGDVQSPETLLETIEGEF